jgi:hypothetical protein
VLGAQESVDLHTTTLELGNVITAADEIFGQHQRSPGCAGLGHSAGLRRHHGCHKGDTGVVNKKALLLFRTTAYFAEQHSTPTTIKGRFAEQSVMPRAPLLAMQYVAGRAELNTYPPSEFVTVLRETFVA